jgi:putative modified peptide
MQHQQVAQTLSEKSAGSQEQRPWLSTEVIDRLLDRLSRDDDYRALFLGEPEQALALIGAPLEFARCCKVTQLASKEAIVRTRDLLRSELVGVTQMIIPSLDCR